MSIQINDIVDELFNKHKLSRIDIERIVKSEWKLLATTIREKGEDTVNLIYLGKVKNTPYRRKQLKVIKNEVVKEIQRDN